MTAGNGDAIFLQAHQLGQHFSPHDHRHVGLFGADNLGVVFGDGRGGHHHIGPFDPLATVALINLTAEPGEIFGDGRAAEIGSGDFVAKIQQEFGDPAHADAADADEMDVFGFPVHGVLPVFVTGRYSYPLEIIFPSGPAGSKPQSWPPHREMTVFSWHCPWQ